MKPKILVILGPTAVGKSDLAVELAKKYFGEVISADSRQVYKGLDIGSGKITKREMRGVPHHLLDVLSPKKVFTVDLWKEKAEKAIRDIISRGKLPLICGGTGFYIQSIVDNIILPNVPPNKTLRKELETKSTEELFMLLKKLDPKRAKDIDAKNPVRLVRAIEIAKSLGTVPKMKREKSPYDFIQIGLTLPSEILKERIHARLTKRLPKMIAEVRRLHLGGLSWKRLESFGLEYRFTALYLQKKISKADMLERLEIEIGQYARRQMQWFKRDDRIKWFEPEDTEKINKTIYCLTINNR